MDKLKVAVVAPVHLQPSPAWIKAVDDCLKGRGERKIIIIDDSAKQDLLFPAAWDVYTKDRQEEFLGSEKYKQFQMFHRSSACKSLGNFIAWKEEFDVIIGLDFDCIPPMNFVAEHVEGLKRQGYGWTNPILATGWFPRGYPYSERIRKVIGNLGLWRGTLDLGGKDRVMNGAEPTEPMNPLPHAIADGFVPFSGMNWALLREAMPGFLFLPNFQYEHGDGTTFKFRRHDDIWGGYILQRFMEKRNERLCYGDPVVFHDSPVDAQKDANEEEAAMLFENPFYTAIDLAVDKVETGTYEDMMLQFTKVVEKDWKNSEWEQLIPAFQFWSSLFMS